jgi:hypothetical protein
MMSRRYPCHHLCHFQNALYCHPAFRLFCAASQEVTILIFEATNGLYPAKITHATYAVRLFGTYPDCRVGRDCTGHVHIALSRFF